MKRNQNLDHIVSNGSEGILIDDSYPLFGKIQLSVIPSFPFDDDFDFLIIDFPYSIGEKDNEK